MIIDTNYIKKPVALIVGLSVGAVVKRVIQNNVDAETKLHIVQTFVASGVLGGMVAKAAKEYTDESIDRFFKPYEVEKESPEIPVPENQE